MKVSLRLILPLLFTALSLACFSQTDGGDISGFKPDHAKEKMYLPYLGVRHGGWPNVEAWKKTNKVQYYKELWYYTESFYIKRNHLAEGVTLDESIIDISRFESSRKENEEAIVVLPGFKDVLVLLPASKLLYKP